MVNRSAENYGVVLQDWCRRYNEPMGGFGGNFAMWVDSNNPRPYSSWGNGSAMRVSPVGLLFGTLEEIIKSAQATAIVTHNHPFEIGRASCRERVLRLV